MTHIQTQLEQICLTIRNSSGFISNSYVSDDGTDVVMPEILLNLLGDRNESSGTNFNNGIIQDICDNILMMEKSPTANSSPLMIRTLVKYIYPVLLVFGLFGNFISLLAMTRIYSRRKNYLKFSLSLATLALTDLIVLLIGCLREYLDDVFSLSIRSTSNLSCKLIFFGCYLFSCFSAYLHGYIAIERWLAITDPIKSMSRTTFHSNKLALGIIFAICVLFNLPLLWFPSVQTAIQLDESSALGVRTVDDCQVTHDLILFLIDSVFYCLIPILVTILFSTLTLMKLIRSKSIFHKSDSLESHKTRKDSVKNAQQDAATTNASAKKNSPNSVLLAPASANAIMGSFEKRASSIIRKNSGDCIGRVRFFNRNSNEPNNTSNANNTAYEENKSLNEEAAHSSGNNMSTNNASTPAAVNKTRDGGAGAGSSFKSFNDSMRMKGGARLEIYKNSRKAKNSSNLKITIMLMALPVSYLVTTFPIFFIIIRGLLISRFDLSSGNTKMSNAYEVGKIFMYVNNSINILFYILFGKNLRKDFIAILPCTCLYDRCCSKPEKDEINNTNNHQAAMMMNYRNNSVRRAHTFNNLNVSVIKDANSRRDMSACYN
jgi:hypothetical protein